MVAIIWCAKRMVRQGLKPVAIDRGPVGAMGEITIALIGSSERAVTLTLGGIACVSIWLL